MHGRSVISRQRIGGFMIELTRLEPFPRTLCGERLVVFWSGMPIACSIQGIPNRFSQANK